MTNAERQKAREEINKKYGVGGTYTPTRKNETTGKQSNSASSGKSERDIARERINEKYGVGGSTPKTTTTVKPSTTTTGTTPTTYEELKKKATTKTTITSDLSEEQRQSRIKEIKSELSNLSKARNGLSRAGLYGNVDKMIAENEAKQSALSKELKELERVGTFSASEMKQFEIDDAKAKKAALPQYNPTARISPSQVESFNENRKAHSEIDEAINLLEREQAEYRKIEKLEELNGITKKITSNKDFAQNSKYSPITPKTDEELKAAGYKKDAEGKWYRLYGLGYREGYTGEDSDLYTYINDESKRLSLEVDREMLTGKNTYKMLGYHTLTEEEKGAFNYLYHQDRKNGTNTAEEYLQSIGYLLESRAMELEAKRYAEISKEAPVFMSGISLGTNLANAMMFPAKAAATATGSYDDMPMLDMYGNRTQAIRGAVSEDMGVVGKTLYNAGMSLGDMGVAMLAGGGNAKMIQLIMSSSAGSSTISNAKKNGASDGKALVLGIGSAAIEWATEKYSVEAILKKPETLFGYIMTNIGTEGTEEGASNLGNWALDTIVSEVFGERNELEQRIDYLVLYEGKTEAEALGIACNEKMMSLGEDVIVGGLSGFGMSSAVGTASVTANAIENNRIATKSKDNEVILDGLIKEGKDIGGDSAKIAAKIEAKVKSGKKVTTSEVKSLIAATERVKKAEAKTTTPTPTTPKRINTVSGIELLENRKRGTVTADMLETLTQNDIDITADEVKAVTNFGDKGSEYIANKANVSGVTFSQAYAEVREAYLDGYTNAKSENVDTNAYTAGQMDRQTSDAINQAKSKNATIYAGEVVENEFSDRLTPQQRKMWETVAKPLGLRMEYVEKIVAAKVNDIEYEANAQHEDGVVSRSITSERSFVDDTLEEALHRMGQVATPEYNILMNALYQHAAERDNRTIDAEKSLYDRIGKSLDIYGQVEEVATSEAGLLFRNEAEFNRWHKRVMADQKLKSAWQKFVDYLGELIEKVHRLLGTVGMTKKERSEYKKTLAEIDRMRNLLASALKATESAVSDMRSGTQSQQTTDAKTEGNGYDAKSDKGFSLKTPPITVEMTDTERTKILSLKSIVAPIYKGQADTAIADNSAKLDSDKIGLVKEAIVTIGEQFGIIGENINIEDVDVQVRLSKTNLRESVSKKATPTELAKLIPVLKDAVRNAIGIERHDNRYYYDSDTVYFENLLGGYVDGGYFVPVRFGLKHSKSGKATLYVVVDQNKIPLGEIKKTEVVKTTAPLREKAATSASRSVTYKISQIIPFVNSGDLLRYLPDDMLNSNQKEIKWEAISDTIKTTAEKNDQRYKKYISEGKIYEAQKMVEAAAKAHGYTIEGYHGTGEDFNIFSEEKVGGRNVWGKGFYFGTSKSIAEDYASWRESKGGKYRIIPAFLKMTNPYTPHKSSLGTASEILDRWFPDMWQNSRDLGIGYIDGKLENSPLDLLQFIAEHNNIEIRDVLAEYGYDSVKDGGELVVFKNTRIKSADLITYDDNDNIIPISERFNEQKNDIRYSLKEEIKNLSPEEKTAVNALGKGAGVITNKSGDMLIATNKDKSTVMYSLKTYNDGGKEALEKALRANGHTETEIAETLSYVDDAADYLTILAAGYAKTHNYTALSNHLIADVITNVKTGKQVISSIVNNGDYPVNIDLALICKKRVAYMNLMTRLIDDGIFDKVNYGGEAIAKVNQLLRADGFETACLGCFVESRRLQFQTWAETIVSEWNAEVDKRKTDAGNFNFADGKAKLTDAEMDALTEELKNAGKKNAQGNLNLGQGSVQTRMGRLLDKVPSLQKHLTVADLLKPDGLTALRAYDSNLFSLVKSRYGAASPKIVQDYNPYAGEIAMLTFSSVKNITSNAVKGADAYRRKVINEMGGNPVKQKGETNEAFKTRKAEFNAKVEDEAIRRYLYDIGGARIQSFSDFMIENVFDYIQIFADLSAKRLPLHGYTKEIIALRLFGMTGAKWNGSWIAHVDRDMGKEYAGLLPASEAKDGSAILVHTEDGDYAIGFDDYARYKATNKKSFIQSIGMKDMVALQLDPRYSPYVGSITIGVSDKQILAMLDSPLFRFVIPYHSSGMLPQFAKLVGVDLYNDYTDYQNTSVKKWFDAYGNPCNPIKDSKGETLKVDTSYNFNAEVQKTGDAKKAAANYLKWCDQKHPVYDKKKLVGYVTFSPKFSSSPYGTDFSKHENYYKLLEDFNVYDSITEESAVQGAVTMTFPSENNRLSASEMEAYKERLRETGIFTEKEIEKYSKIADKTFKELIADEVKGRAEYQQAQAPKWENTVKNVEQMLLNDHSRTSFSLKGSKPTPTAIDHTKITVAIEDMQNGVQGASKRLAKYVDNGMISTEAYKEMVKKYGAIPQGEKPHREVKVPQKTSDDKKVSQTVRTILEAKATPDATLPTIEKMVEDGIFSYDVYTDKQAIKDAEDYIKEYGWAESYSDWMNDIEKGIVSKQHTVMGWALYNNAVNTATTSTSETERKTAMETAINVLDAMVRHQRNAAQALQATRVLKKLAPETQLYGIQKSVSAYQKELTAKYGKKAPNLKINDELAEKFLNAKTEEERLDAEIEIYKDIGRQMPSDWLDMWNAWRYVAMLTNLRTHGRNIVGNAGFAPIVGIKNLTATAIESAVYHLGGKKMLRGKALVWGSKTDRALLKAAWEDYSNVADIVSNGGKYNDSAMGNKYIQEGRRIFKGILSPVEYVRRGNSWLLEYEDMMFSKPHYAYALAQYCKANNITPEQIKRGKAIAPAREYAIKEAQKATYKDTNAFSQFVSEIGRNGENKSGAKKAAAVVVEGVLPFRKTPANILVRGVEYSPIGLIKGLTRDLYLVGKNEMPATEAIDNISAGLTGTGLLALGVLLAAQGLIRGNGSDDEDERKFEELMGHQAYSLELPNGQSATLDWLAPESLPFFTGVNIWEATTGKNEDITLSEILSAVTNISDPMLQMSFLQGLNDVFESVGYASSNDTSALVSVLSTAATSYLTQGIPTLFGQIERTGEEERMTTYTEKNGFLTSDMQYTLGKASAKIPFWDYNQIPYIDAWGRKEASGSALKRGLNNFLNPAYTSTIETSDMEKELLRLFESTGEGGVFPSRADKKFTVDGKDKHLTGDEYVRYATLKGEKSYKVVSDLVSSKAYRNLSDPEKVKAIKEAYDYANQKAKQAISGYKPENWVAKADEFGSNVGNFISFKTEVGSTKAENGGKIAKEEIVDIILDMAQNDSEMWKMYLTEYESNSDKYAYKNGIDGDDYMRFLLALKKYDKPNKNGKLGTFTQAEEKRAIDSLRGLTNKEKAILYKSVNLTSKSNPY